VDLIFDIINKQREAVETRTQESASNIDEQVKSLIPEIVKKIEMTLEPGFLKRQSIRCLGFQRRIQRSENRR